jgi:RNA polymerase sigma factor (sigma-70 family)
VTQPKNDADRRAEPKPPRGAREPHLRGLKRPAGGVEHGARHVGATKLESARAARKAAAPFDQTGTGAFAWKQRRDAGSRGSRRGDLGLASRVCHKFWPGSNIGVVPSRDLSRCSDEELLEIALGDARAFGVFYDRHEVAVLAFFRRASGRAELAADLTGEVFAAALASLDAFRQDLGSARAWLFGIARHELAQSYRRGRVEAQARRRLGMEPIMLSDDDLQRIDELGQSASLDSLALLESLPAEQRAAVRGRVIEDRDYEDLATEFGCSEMVVRQRVSRGLRLLRALSGYSQ